MFYRLHGLHVHSNEAVPGLASSEPFEDIDLHFVLGDDPESPRPQGQESGWFVSATQEPDGRPSLVATWLGDREFCQLKYSDGVTFVIDRDATHVWATWPATLTIKDVPTYLLGPIIGLILRFRDITSLHASAVLVGGHAVIFAGHAGAGKSTTAAALAMKGNPVLCDDTVSLRREAASWFAAPGYPRMRLWPDSASALVTVGGTSGFLPPGVSGSTSRYHLDLLAAGRTFERDPRPVGMVYLLERAKDEKFSATRAPANDALIALVANTYAAELLDREQRAAEFDDLAQFVADVPVRRLSRPADLDALPRFAEFVLNDLAACGIRGTPLHGE